MDWRLNAMTVIAKGLVMALLVFVGANIVHNVTAALMAAVGVCARGVTHLL